MATYTRRLRVVDGSETLVSAKFVALSGFTLSATDYWTFTLRVRRAATATTAAQSNGEQIGDTLSLATRTLTADTPVTLYESAQGTALGDGDTLVLVGTTTGSPAALDQPEVRLDLQRNTR